MVKYSKGTYNKSICDRCGFATPYLARKRERSGLYVCSDCYDGRFQAIGNPRDKAPYLPPEGILKEPRRDAFVQTSVTQITDLPPSKQGK